MGSAQLGLIPLHPYSSSPSLPLFVGLGGFLGWGAITLDAYGRGTLAPKGKYRRPQSEGDARIRPIPEGGGWVGRMHEQLDFWLW